MKSHTLLASLKSGSLRLTTLALPLAAIAAAAACQPGPSGPAPSPRPTATATASPVSSPSPSASADPSPSPSSGPVASPSPSSQQSVTLYEGCDGTTIVCPAGAPCAVPSCAPSSAPLAQEAPLFIDEAKYDALAQRFGLRMVARPEDHLGGLSPQLPLAIGYKSPCEDGEGLYRSGGRLNACVVYIAQTGSDSYALIDSQAAAKTRFAPIESREEAISYAALVTGYEPRYQIAAQSNWRYFSGGVSPTRVSEKDGVYSFALWDPQIFGCGPHPQYSVALQLTRAGELTQIARANIYEDPAQDGLCVD